MKAGITNFCNTLKNTLLYMVYKNRNYLVVLLHEKTVTLAIGAKTGNKLHCSNIVTHQLSNMEIANEYIFSPTHIQALLQNFATTNYMIKPHIIAFIQFLPKQVTNFQLLQIVLCLSKKPFTIEYLSQNTISLPMQELLPHQGNDCCPSSKQLVQNANLLERFLPTGYHVTAYLVATLSTILLIISVVIFSIHQTITIKLSKDEQKSNALTNTIQKLQQHVKTLHGIEKQNVELTNRITTLTTVGQIKNNPYDILITIAQAMPPQSKLVSLLIGKDKNTNAKTKQSNISHKKNPKHKKPLLVKNTPFMLKGLTHDPEEISNLVKTLSKNFPNTNFSLHHSNPKGSSTSQAALEPPFKFIIRVTAS